MTPYDAGRFSPAAPVAQVKLRQLDTRATVTNVSMLIDSGADVTLVPAHR